jgi:2,5-diamino-6-(ribosylamino)-4(3H)-pyrimidinone 5'-phosphate reductase
LTEKATRLYPLPPREVPAGEIYADLELSPPGRQDFSRPYVIINMVSSIDGKSTIWGRTAGLGDEADRQTMRNLRSKADAVMVGAGTLRSERISLGLDEPADGPQPLAVVATKTGDVPLENNLILHKSQEVLLLLPENLHVPRYESARWLRVPGGPSGNMDLWEALKRLKNEHAVDLLLVEGGPTLNHALASRGLADEVFLTLAPKLLGGEGRNSATILGGAPLPPEASSPKLLSGHLAGDELFLRYELHPPSKSV